MCPDFDQGPACGAEGGLSPASEACPRGNGGCRLRDLPDGVRTHVRELRGCQRLRSRLYSLGLVPGTEIIVRGQGDTGCRIEVRDTCVVLDCESAANIVCDEVGGGRDAPDPCRGASLQTLFGRHARGRKGERHG
ncbi:FeoA family protein (modular protein) [uncultured delta proteobacterium]|uniref:FeoA family protein (Modular protein) n=1 Tax=uncultured delta proteobacterium TaxID=34034 RepID=A0A212KBS1_9DELT|nr:FeoA family protein (modular protein) [uncultured delta proteobacterium]